MTEKEADQIKAEREKKALFYDPQTCPDMNAEGCTYPDCDNCQCAEDDEFEETEDW